MFFARFSDPSLYLDDSDVSSEDEDTVLQDTADSVPLSEGVTTTTSLTALLQSRTERSTPKSLRKVTIVTPPELAILRKEEPSVDQALSNSVFPQVESEQTESTVVTDRTEKPKGLKDLLTAGVEDKYNADGSPVQVEAVDDDTIKVFTLILTSFNCLKAYSFKSKFIDIFRIASLFSLSLTHASMHVYTHTHPPFVLAQIGSKRPHPEGEDVLLSPHTFCKRHEACEEGHESGTTAVVCLLQREKVFVANAGDSRCILSSAGRCDSGCGLDNVHVHVFHTYVVGIIATASLGFFLPY